MKGRVNMASITLQTKNGKASSYKIKVCLGRTAEGKQVFRCTTWKIPEGVTPSRAERMVKKVASEWETKVKLDYQQDLENPERVRERMIDQKKTDFVSFIREIWFPLYVDNGEHRPKTVSFYNDTVKNIVNYFEGKVLQNITAVELQQFLVHLRTREVKPLAAQTIHHHYRTLNMIFSCALKLEYIRRNPMVAVNSPKLGHNKVEALSNEEAEQFFLCLNSCDVEFQCLLMLFITTGIRRGELCGLQWRDLDLDNGLLKVERNVTYTKASGIVVSEPKTIKSIRTIPMTSSMIEILKLYKKQFVREYENITIENCFVFPSNSSALRPRDPHAVTRRVKRFMKRSGLPDMSPHDLRHSCGTLLLNSGADVKSVQEILGHADAQTTLNFYVKPDIQQMRTATDKFAAAFGL